MNILLIQSSHLNDDGSVFKSRHLLYPGLALPLIAGLCGDDDEVRIVNDYFEDIPYDAPADLVGISAMTPQAPRAYRIAAEFQRRGVPVAMGGFHPSLFPDEAGEHCDSVCIGEAEGAWPRLLDDIRAGRGLQHVYRNDELVDMASIPTPRYDLLNMSGYSLKAIPVQTTRGCPRRCDFCSVRVFYGNRYRYRPIEHVVRDIEASGYRRIFFIDDNIASNADRFVEMCRQLEPLKLTWGSQCNVDAVTDERVLKAAADSGCYSLFLGVESVNPDVLKTVKKGFNKVEHYAEAFAKMRKYDIMPMVSMIVGLDGDGPEVFRRDLEFLIDNDIPVAYVFILAPAPGTEFFDRWQKEGRLTSFDWTKYSGEHVVFHPSGMTPEQLRDGLMWMYRRFYSGGCILQRFLKYPPITWNRLVALKYNILHRRSVRKGLHPLRG